MTKKYNSGKVTVDEFPSSKFNTTFFTKQSTFLGTVNLLLMR